jgi:hypothetical protein
LTNESFRPDDSRVIARYQHELSEANDAKLRFAALADSLADQVVRLQGELRVLRETGKDPEGPAPRTTPERD